MVRDLVADLEKTKTMAGQHSEPLAESEATLTRDRLAEAVRHNSSRLEKQQKHALSRVKIYSEEVLEHGEMKTRYYAKCKRGKRFPARSVCSSKTELGAELIRCFSAIEESGLQLVDVKEHDCKGEEVLLQTR